jgi:hypothetical protein
VRGAPGRTRRDLAVKDQRFRGAPAHQHGDAVFEVAARQQEPILGGPLDGVAKRPNTARND